MKNIAALLSAMAGLALLPAVAGAQIAESPVADAPVHGSSLSRSVAVASWYGARHQGLRTSSGEIFDQDGMTAASRNLPLGTRVRVTLHETGRSVVVRVNDRMGARTAAIDLSRGAAKEIGLLGRGRGVVSIDPAEADPVEVAEVPEAGVLARSGHRHLHRDPL